MDRLDEKVYIDGHWYAKPEDAPDLGSLVGTSKGIGTPRSYTGLFSDFDKLPHYADLPTGSDAQLVDTSDSTLHYCVYQHDTDTWYDL